MSPLERERLGKGIKSPGLERLRAEIGAGFSPHARDFDRGQSRLS